MEKPQKKMVRFKSSNEMKKDLMERNAEKHIKKVQKQIYDREGDMVKSDLKEKMARTNADKNVRDAWRKKLSDESTHYKERYDDVFECMNNDHYPGRTSLVLNVKSKVTPGSKASLKGILASDQILSINGNITENLTHMDAQNLIKNAGDRLELRLKQGAGGPPGDVSSGAFAAQPKMTLYQTDVTHSAGVDHKYNAKPKSFISSTGSSTGGVSHVSVPVNKFDPKEYARRKKEELEKYKEEKSADQIVVDSDVLKMLQKTSVQDTNTAGLQKKPEEGQQQVTPAGNVAFRMTAEGTDLADVSPGSRAVMEDIKNRGTSSLNNSGAVSGGSRSFRILQHLTSQDEDLPPPPPELMGNLDQEEEHPPRQVQSNTFKMLQQHVEAGTGDQVRTGLDKPRNPSHGNVAQPPSRNVGNRSDYHHDAPTVDPIPKAPFPTGPNFKVGRPSAPTFKSGSGSNIGAKPPPPPAVNAGEIVNPNSRLFQTGAYPAGGTAPAPAPEDYGRGRFNSKDDFGRGHMGSGSNLQPQPPSSSNNPPVSPNSLRSPSGRGPSQSTEKTLVCQACQQPLGGPFVSAIGKTWHPEHFCCSSCKVSLQNQAFVEENNQLFCEKCYNQYYAPKCAHCNNAIIGNCVNALGKSWHPDHFVCSFCNRSFGTDGFLVDNGRPYCEKCFEDLFSVKCAKCAHPIAGGDKYVEALNKNWHSECFNCYQCNVRLEGNSFYVNRGMPYCYQHKALSN